MINIFNMLSSKCEKEVHHCSFFTVNILKCIIYVQSWTRWICGGKYIYLTNVFSWLINCIYFNILILYYFVEKYCTLYSTLAAFADDFKKLYWVNSFLCSKFNHPIVYKMSKMSSTLHVTGSIMLMWHWQSPFWLYSTFKLLIQDL